MVTRRELVRALSDAVGESAVVYRPEDLRLYEYDATIEKSRPYAVVLPANADQVAACVRVCRDFGIPITPRGAGTGLSGGAVPALGGVVISTARMRQILEIDVENRIAVVQPGVANLHVSEAAAAFGLFYAPDPSSQKACTIGGNIAENAGGPHCLALGVTQNHVLGIEVVTADGEITWLGGRVPDAHGYDLRGMFIGSEGTLGIATAVVVKLLPVPPSVRTLLGIFDSIEAASRTVSAIIGAGMIPAALEMMDNVTIRAAEAGLHCGYPLDAGAVLLVELDGVAEAVEIQSTRASEICMAHGAREVRTASSAAERTALWRGRKEAIGSLGQLAPNYYILDGVVPRSRLVETMGKVEAISREYGLQVANVFHAGDGNLHPCILFDEREEGATARVLEAGAAVMRVCVDVGGALSGEHGVGFEKQSFMPWLYSSADLENMGRVRGVFGNSGLFNPCKVLPSGSGCGEMAHQGAAIHAAGPDAYI